jgi:hypothetical protein
MTHREEPDYTYWERDEDGCWHRHEDKYLIREKKGIRAVLSPTKFADEGPFDHMIRESRRKYENKGEIK